MKNGRARFIDENKICLACPPDKISEEKHMEKVEENKAVTENSDVLTVREILNAISEIHNDKAYISEAFAKLDTVKSGGPGDVGAQAKAMAIADVVKCRETTNQKLLDFYQRLYDDIKPKTIKQKAMELVEMALKKDGDTEALSNLMDTIRHIN